MPEVGEVAILPGTNSFTKSPTGRGLHLLRSHLNGRVQRAVVNGTRAPGSAISMSVPKGSILGPFQFFDFINE